MVGLTRSTSYKLRRDESILINVIAPGPVDTPISEMTKKFVPIEHFTPMSLLIKALDMLIKDDAGGRIVECSNKEFYLRDPVPFSDDNAAFLMEDMIRF